MDNTNEQFDPIPESWDEDTLQRIESARFLTAYLNGLYAHETHNIQRETFVLNINAGWGYGKSFLLSNWAKNLRENHYPVIFFDAWKNDYSSDPLIGFISELNCELQPWLKETPKAKRIMKTVMRHARQIASPLAGVIAGKVAGDMVSRSIGALENAFGSEAEQDEKIDTKDIANAVSKFADARFKEHQSIKKAIEDFRKSLTDLIIDLKSNAPEARLPLYVFIDELDRCRPTYAIELLEHIKHLFGVNGVYFVLATNRRELSHAIRAVYGGVSFPRNFVFQEMGYNAPVNWKEKRS